MSRLWRYYWRHAQNYLQKTLTFNLPKFVRTWREGRLDATYITFSPGIAKIAGLKAFLGYDILYLPASAKLADLFFERFKDKFTAVLIWGAKEHLACPKLADIFGSSLNFPQALRLYLTRLLAYKASFLAKKFAKKHNLKLIRLEDGFLRSLNLGVLGASPLSLVVDSCGIYYDSTHASDLENLLNSQEDFSPNYPMVSSAIAEIISANLSKYNHAPSFDASLLEPLLDPQEGSKRILVLDQTKGDLSIELGSAEPKTFTTMLAAAISENPNAQIYLKIHPDVLAGRREGHFDLKNLPDKVRVIAQDCAPISLLQHMDEVYTVSSQMGFEALLLGKKVHCFGLPFYAGWGVTCDRQKCPRRLVKRNVKDIFYAAYMRYAKYIQPAITSPCTIFETIELLKASRLANEQNRGYHACLGFRHWKHSHARAFLSSTAGEVQFFEDTEQALEQAAKNHGSIVVWASKMPDGLPEKAHALGIKIVRMEDGFLRSVGLGSNFYRPGSLVLDDLGIYYDPNHPSRLEAILNSERTLTELEQARKLKDLLVSQGISKYNIQGGTDLPDLPKDQRLILVPGQVEDDASVRLGGLGIHSNLQLLEAVRAKAKDAYIIYKEHPDVVSGNRCGQVPRKDLARLANCVVRTTPIEYVLSKVQEVHTLTSLTGFEALLRGLKVYTYGGPFYAGFGLTVDLQTFPRRRPLPSLEHLIAGALLVYPRYYDWQNGMLIDCFSFLAWLAKARANAYKNPAIL
ncbi:MAG: capsular polysaccharide biosynthesis protein [Desulfovibrionaceae bacterium]|nr:capsular polysaccharide biosynthesis protein [Desulfovibrionaceae bacterium]